MTKRAMSSRVVYAYLEREAFLPPKLTQGIRKLIDLVKKEKPQVKTLDILDQAEMEDFTKTLDQDQKNKFYRIMTKVIGQISLALFD